MSDAERPAPSASPRPDGSAGPPAEPPAWQPGAAGPPPSTRKPRPSAWWFAVGAGLVALAIGIGVTALVLTITRFTETDATVGAGERAEVTVGTEQKLAWIDTLEPARCGLTEAGSGEPVATTPPTASYTKSYGGREWVGRALFTSSTGAVVVDCSDSPGPVQVGPAPQIGGFLGGLAVGILVPLALGSLGLVVLVVTAVLFASRPPRPPASAARPGRADRG